MGFHEVLLPTNLDYGSAGGPSFDVAVTRLDSGSEERNLRWAAELAEYDASYGVKSLEDLHRILRFFRARRGATYGFRYKDFHDFTSTNDGRSTPTNLDQLLGVGDDEIVSFQLIKRYGDPNVATPYIRTITKPMQGSIRKGDGDEVVVFDTVVVAVDGVAQTEGVEYSIDETTGVVLFTTAPANGLDVTAGFQYHVPVRFDIPKRALQASIDAFDSSSTVSAIPLVELRQDDVVIREDYFYGDNLDIEDLTVDTILPLFKRSVRVRECDGVAKLLLPDPTDATGKRIQPGVVHYAIFNHDLANAVEVRDHGDNLVATVPSQDGKTINLASNVIDGTLKRYHTTKDDDAVALPSPYDGPFDENYLLSEVTVAEQTYNRTLGAGSSADVTWLTPVALPGIGTWVDTGHSFVIDVITTGIGSVISSGARLVQVTADGLTIKQTGNGAPSQAYSGAGIRTYPIPSTVWTSVLPTDRFFIAYYWQAQFGGVSTNQQIRLGTGTTYLDTSIQDPPTLRQWIGF